MIRDVQQLKAAPAFSFTAVEGLLAVESALADALKFVPYCNEHLGVWSAPFTTIILEASSQFDSILKATAKLDDADVTDAARLTIVDYHSRYRRFLAKQQVVFFGCATPPVVSPFAVWSQHGQYVSLGWWDAYTALKHDRFSNHGRGTLGHAVSSVAALLLAIIYSGKCDLAIMSQSLLDSGGYNPWAEAKLIREITPQSNSKIETKLFAHPIGVLGADNRVSTWWPGTSVRFNAWWTQNREQFTKAAP